MVLAMTALRPNQKPAVMFKHLDQLPHLHVFDYIWIPLRQAAFANDLYPRFKLLTLSEFVDIRSRYVITPEPPPPHLIRRNHRSGTTPPQLGLTLNLGLSLDLGLKRGNGVAGRGPSARSLTLAWSG